MYNFWSKKNQMKFKHNAFFVDTSRSCWYEETVPWVLFEMWVQCILVHVIKLHPSQNQLKQNKEPPPPKKKSQALWKLVIKMSWNLIHSLLYIYSIKRLVGRRKCNTIGEDSPSHNSTLPHCLGSGGSGQI